MSRTLRRINNRNWRNWWARGLPGEFDVFAKGTEDAPLNHDVEFRRQRKKQMRRKDQEAIREGKSEI